MAVKYLAGDRLIGTAAERAAMTTSASAIPQNSWKEIARTTLGSASSTFNTSTFTGKKYLWVQIYGSRSSGSDDGIIRFNSDSGSNGDNTMSDEQFEDLLDKVENGTPEGGNGPTGSGGGTTTVNVGFQPDLVWLKGMDETIGHNQ